MSALKFVAAHATVGNTTYFSMMHHHTDEPNKQIYLAHKREAHPDMTRVCETSAVDCRWDENGFNEQLLPNMLNGFADSVASCHCRIWCASFVGHSSVPPGLKAPLFITVPLWYRWRFYAIRHDDTDLMYILATRLQDGHERLQRLDRLFRLHVWIFNLLFSFFSSPRHLIPTTSLAAWELEAESFHVAPASALGGTVPL